MACFANVGASGFYILGKRLEEFETSLAQRLGIRYAAGVGSGMDALQIALTIAGCKAGDKVLTTPLSAFATTLAIIRLGASPVFVDTDSFGLLDLKVCRRTLEARPDIRFMVPVHLYGNTLDLCELRRLQDDFEISVVEDCAQSILAAYQQTLTGSVGKLAAISFYPTKNLGAIGDGGAILTSDRTLFEAAKVLRDYGQTAKYVHDRVGYNSRLDELQAALLNEVYLPRLESWTTRRRHIARHYLDGIQHSDIRCIGNPQGSDSCWHLFPILVKPAQKHAFMRYLKRQGVSCAEHYPILIPCQRALADVKFEIIGRCDTADQIRLSEVSLPIHPYLTDDEVDRVIGVCNSWRYS